MLKFINAIIEPLVLCSLCIGQEVECQNGRCDVIKAVAKAPLVIAENVVERVQEVRPVFVSHNVPQAVQQVANSTARMEAVSATRTCLFKRLRKRFR